MTKTPQVYRSRRQFYGRPFGLQAFLAASPDVFEETPGFVKSLGGGRAFPHENAPKRVRRSEPVTAAAGRGSFSMKSAQRWTKCTGRYLA